MKIEKIDFPKVLWPDKISNIEYKAHIVVKQIGIQTENLKHRNIELCKLRMFIDRSFLCKCNIIVVNDRKKTCE